MHISVNALTLLLPVVLAKTIRVDVGNGGLTFNPENVKASVNDELEFHFFPKNHTITQSSFDAPCVPLQGEGINSGFVPTAQGESATTFRVVVADDKKPLWFYCAQNNGQHCQNGMSMVVNEPTNSPNTLAAYKAAAKALTAPSQIGSGTTGGTLGNGTATGTNGTVAGNPQPTGNDAGAGGTGGSGTGAASNGFTVNWAMLGVAALIGSFVM